MKKEEFTIENTNCISYLVGKPEYILLLPVDNDGIVGLDQEVEILSNQSQFPFLMIAFKVDEWNRDLTPWKAPAIFGNEDFGEGARETLSFIERNLLTSIYEKYQCEEKLPIILGGYSLAGLFSLWSAYQTKKFQGIVAASPSVWFKDWLDYINKNTPLTDVIYLSLGDQEEEAKNEILATVGHAIRVQEEILKSQKIKTILEWNKGGHFQKSEQRLSKGFLWCMENID